MLMQCMFASNTLFKFQMHFLAITNFYLCLNLANVSAENCQVQPPLFDQFDRGF